MEDAIHLPPKENFDVPDKYYATGLRELGHWTGEEICLNCELGPFRSESMRGKSYALKSPNGRR